MSDHHTYKCALLFSQIDQTIKWLDSQGYPPSNSVIEADVIINGENRAMTHYEIDRMLIFFSGSSILYDTQGQEVQSIKDLFDGENVIGEGCCWTFTSELDHQSLTNLLIEAEQDNFFLIGSLMPVEYFSGALNNIYLAQEGGDEDTEEYNREEYLTRPSYPPCE